MDKLIAAGISCEMTGYNTGYIQFLGYTHETERKLEQERIEYTAAYTKWKARHSNGKSQDQTGDSGQDQTNVAV